MKTNMTLCFFVCCLLLTLNNVMRTDAVGILQRMIAKIRSSDPMEKCCKLKGCPLKKPKPGLHCVIDVDVLCRCESVWL